MTPQARISAAIEILDDVIAGAPAERALTGWARRHRFAGSSDRGAIRDLVFAVLRQRRSCAAVGGAGDREDRRADGRALILGLLRLRGEDPAGMFTGNGYAPPPLRPDELTGTGVHALASLARPVRLDYPDWLDAPLSRALCRDLEPVMELLRHRAPVFLRVNRRKTDRPRAQAALAREGIGTRPHPLAVDALEVTENARKIRNSQAYRTGLVELQDAASQAVVDFLDPPRKGRILDYCAGGGGKALAIAARSDAQIFAHDAAPQRMREIDARARRAGVVITRLENPPAAAPHDLVLCDVPCSGSGAWRRAPDGKWALTPARLSELTRIQQDILDRAARLVVPGGCLGYVTCSLLAEENESAVLKFCDRNNGYDVVRQRRISPLEGADGFFVALLKRK